MNGVQTISLGEIMAKKSGSVDPSKFPGEVFDLYSIPAFDSRQPEVVAGKLIGSTKQIVEPGDVLLSKIVPHIRRSWVVGEKQGRRIIASGEWIVFRSEKIYPNYLRHVLVSDPFHSKFMSTVSGVGGSLLRARPAFVEKIKIPLPPLEEQQRIADILDHVEALRAKRREALAQLDELTPSLFIEMFGDPMENPKKFEVIKLHNISEIVSGVTKGRKLDRKFTVFVPYLRVANVQDGYLDLTEIKEIEVLPSDVKKYVLRKGDILLTEGGDPDKLGRGAVWNGQISECIHQNHIFRVRVNGEYLIPEYLSALIGSPYGKKYFLKSAKQTTGIASINSTQLKNFPVLIAPLDLQLKFTEVICQIEKIKQSQQQSLLELNNLFDSLSNKAFTGKLFSHQFFEQKIENGVKI